MPWRRIDRRTRSNDGLCIHDGGWRSDDGHKALVRRRDREMEIAMGSGQGDDIDNVLAVLVIIVAAAVLVLETVADILGMDALAVRTGKERYDEDLAVVVVDMDVETDDGGQVAEA